MIATSNINYENDDNMIKITWHGIISGHDYEWALFFLAWRTDAGARVNV